MLPRVIVTVVVLSINVFAVIVIIAGLPVVVRVARQVLDSEGDGKPHEKRSRQFAPVVIVKRDFW